MRINLFPLSKTEVEVILTISSKGSPKTPYELKSDISFSYAGLAKSCRRLEKYEFLTSIESEGMTKGRKIEYYLTAKGCAASISIIPNSSDFSPTESDIIRIHNILKLNSNLSPIFIIWDNFITKFNITFEDNFATKKTLLFYIWCFILCCYRYSGLMPMTNTNQNIDENEVEIFVRCPINKILKTPPWPISEEITFYNRVFNLLLDEYSKHKEIRESIVNSILIRKKELDRELKVLDISIKMLDGSIRILS